MRALALLLLVCAGLICAGSWQTHTTGPGGLVLGALVGAWRLWKSE